MVQIHVCRCRKCESFKISLLNHVYSKSTNVKLYNVTKLLPLLSNYHLFGSTKTTQSHASSIDKIYFVSFYMFNFETFST